MTAVRSKSVGNGFAEHWVSKALGQRFQAGRVGSGSRVNAGPSVLIQPPGCYSNKRSAAVCRLRFPQCVVVVLPTPMANTVIVSRTAAAAAVAAVFSTIMSAACRVPPHLSACIHSPLYRTVR